MSNGLFFNWEYYQSLYIVFQDNGIKVKSTPQIRLWVTSYEVIGIVAEKLSWVDPTSFVTMKQNTHYLYFTKPSGKCMDCYFLVGPTLSTHSLIQLFSYLSSIITFVIPHAAPCFKLLHLNFHWTVFPANLAKPYNSPFRELLLSGLLGYTLCFPQIENV